MGNSMSDDKDDLIFFNDREEGDAATESAAAEAPRPPDRFWKVLIVDDDLEVHSITTLVLKNFSYDGKKLHFLHAYSADEARSLIMLHPDTAVILLDVVMESNDAGLAFVEFVRKVQQNPFVRIILRTGQPGQAPEEKIIVEYDINDYKEKTELSSQKLFTVMVSSLRTYRDILIIEANRRGLRRIIDASANLFELRSLKQLASGVLTQLVSILHMDPNAIVFEASGFAATRSARQYEILAATGKFEGLTEITDGEQLPAGVFHDLQEAISRKKCLYYADRYIGYFKSEFGAETVIYCEGWNELSELNRSLIEIFCTNVHIAFDNTHLNLEIEDTQKEIIYTLGEIAEARSQETGFHVKRVSEFSRLLGAKCGLSPIQVEILRLAAPMHDVGKVAIPDRILNNPGPLSENEFSTMKNHAAIGRDMLISSSREIMKAAAIIAVEHHEKYDGTGYPAGLRGEDIHIFARITTIADVFDALCNDRVYRKAYDMSEILAYFSGQRGKHFDPALVDIFLANIDDFIKIKQELSRSLPPAPAPGRF
jgi:response regulator RpfG family c-di-GMP phosphodiesterase